jgi:indole-3-acetate monooxygenase
MPVGSASDLLAAPRALAPMIKASADTIEKSRRLPPELVEALTEAGVFRVWVPRSLGGLEADPMTFVRVVEEIAFADASVGWCAALGGELGVVAGYLPLEVASAVFDSNARLAGALRPMGTARIVEGGFRATGRWPLASGCRHSNWILGGCRILDGDQQLMRVDGAPDVRVLFFPAEHCEIIDTWDSIGLRGSGSEDFAVADLFVPSSRAISFRDPPTEPGPLYALPTIALFATALAAVPLGAARHAISLLKDIAATKITSRTRQVLSNDGTMQTNLGRAEALVRSGRAFLHEAVEEAWDHACTGRPFGAVERATLWLATTHAASSARQAAELMYAAGGTASPYASGGLERPLRDIFATCQHVVLSESNYQLAGQAFVGLDVRSTALLAFDDRGG